MATKMTDEQKVIAKRQHIVMKERDERLRINILGWKGGRPYIEERLSRFAGEVDVDWEGGKKQNKNVTGRLEQSHNLPYLSRITDKINQYTFASVPKRDGIDKDFQKDVTRTGENITQVMTLVNSYLSVTRWCWMKVDMPKTEGEVTKKEKETKKIRPFWSVIDTRQVVDWHINSAGETEWVLIEWWDYQASDPRKPAVNVRFRSLYEPGKLTRYQYGITKDKDKIVSQKTIDVGLNIVPIFPVGQISEDPHWFDDTEMVNRSIMNLGSVNYANFFRCVYPQLVIPRSVLRATMEEFKVDAQTAASMILGYNYPILVAEGDKEPKYLMPDAASIGTIRTEIDKLVKEMHGTVGLIHEHPSIQIQSGISKEFDFQDIVSVVKERATILENAETKAAEISMKWDDTFKLWVPEYNRELEVGTLKDDLTSLVTASSMQMPAELMRFILTKFYERVKKIGTGSVEPKLEKAIIDAIAEFEPNAAMEITVPDTDPFKEGENE